MKTGKIEFLDRSIPAEKLLIEKIKKLEFHPSHPSAFSILMKAEGCEG